MIKQKSEKRILDTTNKQRI